MPFFINLLLIEAKLLPQSSYFASNIFRFGEEPDKFTKMLPELNDTILMSDLKLVGVGVGLCFHMSRKKTPSTFQENSILFTRKILTLCKKTMYIF